MFRGVLAIAIVALGSSNSWGQPATPPPGSGAYFGAAPGQTFDDKAVFTQPPPAPKPVTVPDGSLPALPPKIWTGAVEFGLNGGQGDTNVLNIKFGTQLDRKTERNLFHTDFLYALNRENGTISQNQALWNSRHEHLFTDTPWSLFSALQIEYDQLRSYDLRFGLYGGLSYAWLNNDITLFKTRAGAGAMREMSTQGGPPGKWVPEAVLGMDLNHKFTERQAFVSTVDVYPSLSNLGQYRVRARAAYEILVNPDYGMVLRLGIQERYDSNPGEGQRNALNYFATLMFRF